MPRGAWRRTDFAPVTASLNSVRKNTKFGNRISLDSSGNPAASADSENEVIARNVVKTHFSTACEAMPRYEANILSSLLDRAH